ncbi:hypothetical protein AB9K41_04085, partial [Cribrihabitans sp. XS_ASV171]
MTKKSQARRKRGHRKSPHKRDVAGVVMMDDKAIFLTKDILIKQLKRDGPNVARSFDKLARQDLKECSHVFARVQTIILPHLAQPEENDFKVIAA